MHEEKRRKMMENGVVVGNGSYGGDVVDISASLASALGLGKGGGRRGMKDMRNDVSQTILTVFRRMKKRIAADGSRGGSLKDVDRVLKSVDCFGDNTKTLDCVFTNILNVSYVDPTMDRCYTAHEWLSSADMYRSSKSSVSMNNSAEHFSMQKFHIPSAAAAIHLLCRVETPGVSADLTYSAKQMIEARYQLEANCGLVNRFVEGLSAKARVGMGGGLNAVVDVVPYSLWLLSAGEGNCSLTRAVSSVGIMSKNEKIAFESHVAILRALGLTYVKADDVRGGEANMNGRIPEEKVMRLEPEIDQVARFSESTVPEGQQRKEIPSALKELLAHGANVEKIREREQAAARNEEMSKIGQEGFKSGLDLFKKARVTQEPKAIAKQTLKRPLEEPQSIPSPSSKRNNKNNFLGIGASRAKAARTKRKAMNVGFDRTKKVKLSNSGSGLPMTKVIKFKYQKGFTQAVRQPCLVEDLI
uniref:Uncharacterized protein n=1 Tax=Ditylum brightwellii TaxID=49249 RepID=A0A7S1YYE2_9STRA